MSGYRVLEDGDAVCLACGTRLEGGERTALADAIAAHGVFCEAMRERQRADAGEGETEPAPRGARSAAAGGRWPRRPLPQMPPEALTVRAGVSERVFLEELEAYERERRAGS